MRQGQMTALAAPMNDSLLLYANQNVVTLRLGLGQFVTLRLVLAEKLELLLFAARAPLFVLLVKFFDPFDRYPSDFEKLCYSWCYPTQNLVNFSGECGFRGSCWVGLLTITSSFQCINILLVSLYLICVVLHCKSLIFINYRKIIFAPIYML